MDEKWCVDRNSKRINGSLCCDGPTTRPEPGTRNTPDIPCMFKTVSTHFARRTVSQADKQCIGYRVKAKVISTHFAWQSFFEIKQGVREKRASRVERRTEHSHFPMSQYPDPNRFKARGEKHKWCVDRNSYVVMAPPQPGTRHTQHT